MFDLERLSLILKNFRRSIDLQQRKNKFHILFYTDAFTQYSSEFVGNKAKGQISKRVFYENKARQILKKTNIFCAYQGVKNVRFQENLTCRFLETPVLRFALLPFYGRIVLVLFYTFSLQTRRILLRVYCFKISYAMSKIRKM